MFNTDQLSIILQFFAATSILTFVVSIVCIPLLVGRLPSNFFQLPQESSTYITKQLSPISICILLLRNLTGTCLLLAGIIMLFLPGQGLITIIIGLGLMTFPYKNQLLYKMTRPETVQKSLDWIRKKMNKESFEW